MSSKQLITEISRIKEMMGITESKILLKESVGDEIVEILAKFLRKDIGELTTLGVRNANDLKRLMDDFLDPAVSSANKVDVLKYIIDDLGNTAIKSIAKEALDDVTTGVGKLVNDRMAGYIDAYKKGIVSYDEIVTQVSDDLTALMSKSSDELLYLKSVLHDDALLKIRNQLDNANVINKVSGSADDAIDQLIKNNEKVGKVLDRFKSNDLWGKLSQRQRTLIEDFVNANKDMDYLTLIAKTDDQIKKHLVDNLSPNLAQKIWKRWKLLKGWKKWGIGILLLGTTLKATKGTGICAVRNVFDWAGEWTGAWNMEDQEAWNKCDLGYKPEEEEEEVVNSECPGEAAFKTAVETVYGGAANVDATKYGAFDTEKCAGTYDGATYTWDNKVKDWN